MEFEWLPYEEGIKTVGWGDNPNNKQTSHPCRKSKYARCPRFSAKLKTLPVGVCCAHRHTYRRGASPFPFRI